MVSDTAPTPLRRTWVEHHMGMPVSVLARGPGARGDAAAAAVAAVFAELADVDATFSTYRPDSPVSRIGRGELPLAEAPELVREVAARCERAREATGGLFDPTRPDGCWDPSGLVKGWAVERATRLLAAVDGLDWCLNAGGDVAVLCPSGTPFTVGVQDPADATRLTDAVPCAVGGVATSGTAARGEHLYDPRTGAAATAVVAVTVTGPSLEAADVLATAAFVAGSGALAVVAGAPGYEALRVDLDGYRAATPGWSGRPVLAGQPVLAGRPVLPEQPDVPEQPGPPG